MKKSFLKKIKSKHIATAIIAFIGICFTSCKMEPEHIPGPVLPSKTKSFYITFDTDGGSEVPFQRIWEGTKVSPVKAPKKENYGFDGWYLGDSLFNFETEIHEDITLKAHWKWLYTITLETNGGQDLAALKIKDGYTATPSIPTKPGRIFKGWFTESTFDNEYDDSVPVTKDFTLFAKWETQTYPNPYKFHDGTFVETPEQWAARAEEIYNDYQSEMYGKWRTGETVTWELAECQPEPIENEKIINLTVTRPDTQKSTSFSAHVRLPDPTKCTPPDADGWPFVIGISSGVSENIALENGYAFIYPGDGNMQTIDWGGYKFTMEGSSITDIAADNINHTGKFYDLYPYSEEQTGELMAWGWGLSKIIDALYDGAAEELGINEENSIVTGVSRYGKAAAVCGTFEKRIKLIAPGDSGAGGMASYRYFPENNTFDLTSTGGSANYVWTANEHLGNLQSTEEGGWFNDKFRSFKSPEDFELDQYMLAAINADPNRYFVIIGASCNGSDWVNGPAMWLTYRAAETIYDFLGLGDHIGCYLHNSGHAVAEDDMMYLLDFFNDKVYGKKTNIAPYDYNIAMKTSVYEEAANYDSLYDEIDEQWNHPEDNERNHAAKLNEIRQGAALYK